MIEYNNYQYTVEQTSKICFQKNSFDVARLGNGVVIKSRRYNFTVFYNSEGDIKIGVSLNLDVSIGINKIIIVTFVDMITTKSMRFLRLMMDVMVDGDNGEIQNLTKK